MGGQYEVQGCIAHGGLGWIYLAIDRNVHNRWVVLKGLLNSGDADAMAAAKAEVAALARGGTPEHRPDPQLRRACRQRRRPGRLHRDGVRRRHVAQAAPQGPQRSPPRDQAVAYVVEIAPALDYLHTQGLAYCDFKPDNVMHTDEQLKLIDLGAVVAMDDEDCVIYGTRGYQAPEIAETGPTVASDVYTVGRDARRSRDGCSKERGRFVEQLPGPATVPVLASTNRCTGRSSAPPIPIRGNDSRPWRRWPIS